MTVIAISAKTHPAAKKNFGAGKNLPYVNNGGLLAQPNPNCFLFALKGSKCSKMLKWQYKYFLIIKNVLKVAEQFLVLTKPYFDYKFCF